MKFRFKYKQIARFRARKTVFLPAQQLAAWKLWGGKILIGPWGHEVNSEEFAKIEHLRWLDHTLKGIQNGIIDEPPIYYFTINAPDGKRWKYANEWPLPNQKPTNYYFELGPTVLPP